MKNPLFHKATFFALVLLLFTSARALAVFIYATPDAFEGLRFTSPVALVTPAGETNRLFIVERGGTIAVITNLAKPTRTVFQTFTNLQLSGESGLLGLAFHPGHATNGFFYVFYTVVNGSTTFDRLSRFQADPSNTNQALAGSEVILISQPDRAFNHNGGDLHFGADGYLYVALGDEGAGNDSFQNSQTINKDFFSGILRLDVDKRPGNLPPNSHASATANYYVPTDNPFVGATEFNGVSIDPSTVRTEFWAVGLRNPWRMSFDPATGDLYCGDVGQNAREEINIITRGGNYGWNYREGDIARPGSTAPPAAFSAVEPIFSYPRTATNGNIVSGTAVIGGVVYRGSTIPQLHGSYVFGDFEFGNIWALRYDGTSVTNVQFLTKSSALTAFGRDPRNGDVLIASYSENRIRKLIYTSDTGLPTVKVLYPASGLTFSNNPTILLRGTAFDAVKLASVNFQLNGAPAEIASGTTNWSASIQLVPGTNTVVVKSVDTSGNESIPTTVKVFFFVTNQFAVTINGGGTVTPNLNGQFLQIGRGYSITAIPQSGFVFSNWTGGVTSSTPLLKFLMQSNLALTANFIANPYLGGAGVYNALFQETNAIRLSSAGFLSVTVSTNASYTGRISVDGNVAGFSGKFDVAGNAVASISRKGFGKTNLTVRLKLDIFSRSIQGTVASDEGSWSSEVNGYGVPWNTGNPATAFTNLYSVLLPVTGDVTVEPAAYGYATANIDRLGKVVFTGSTSDGQTLAQSVVISGNGDWPLYVPLYLQPTTFTNGTNRVTIKEYKGMFFAWVQITNRTLNGKIHSLNRGTTNVLYPHGFTNEIPVVAATYFPPATGGRALPLTNAVATFFNGNLNGAISNRVVFTNNGFLLISNTNKLSISFTKANGTFSGKFTPPGQSNSVIFRGAFLQPDAAGAGFFLGTNQSGTVLLQK